MLFQNSFNKFNNTQVPVRSSLYPFFQNRHVKKETISKQKEDCHGHFPIIIFFIKLSLYNVVHL